jgi:Terminase large subunit, T4likevirus-type, N-terminal
VIPRAVSLLDACDEAPLFNFQLWPRQRALLEAVERGPRLHVWALGRRSGKTTLAAIVGLWTCLFRPDIAAKVRPGERFYAVAVGTNIRQARLFVSAARSIVEASPLLAKQVESSSDDELVFKTGGVLTAFPCSSRGGRGWPIAALLLDEAAFFISETEGYQTADRVFEALVPSTAQFLGEWLGDRGFGKAPLTTGPGVHEPATIVVKSAFGPLGSRLRPEETFWRGRTSEAGRVRTEPLLCVPSCRPGSLS